MSDSIEGRTASYVGQPRSGFQTGDRCAVVSDEGGLLFVRWLTGAHADSYGEVSPRDVVADEMGTTASMDEFGFEDSRQYTSSIDVTSLMERGGSVTVLAAMEQRGELKNLRLAVREAVSSIHDAVRQDPVWDDVLATDASILTEAILAAVEAEVEGDEGDTNWEDDDDVDSFYD